MNGTWIEVFRGGKQTDSSGKEHHFTDAELDRVIQSYDPAQHEAPVVVGHPKSNAPAYGWVESLKREGKVLFARLKQVAPEFAQLVQDGRFKKRSISFYPNGTLRHIGFLGAMPPAVKGLADIAFEEEDIAVYEYEETTQTPKEGSMDLNEALQENGRLKSENATLKQEKAAAEQKAADFEEQASAEKKKAEKAEKDLADFHEAAAKTRESQAQKEIADFVEQLVKDGKVAPADKDAKIAALTAAAKSQEYEFAEDGDDTFGALKSAFEALPVKDELRDFSEHYPTDAGDGAAIDINELHKKF